MSDSYLLVLAHPGDTALHALSRQEPSRIAHASIADLSRAGWRYESERPEQATACAGGRVISAERIAGVLCRIPVVHATDLPHVHAEDRSYVAAEINAFLFAWLAQFTGVRFNMPTWASLAGPAWHPLQWAWVVANAGLPVATAPAGGAPDEREIVTATVVCGDVFGVTDRRLVDMALAVAAAAHSALLSVTFACDGEWKVLAADPSPQLDAATAAAVLRRAFRPVSVATGASPRALCGAA